MQSDATGRENKGKEKEGRQKKTKCKEFRDKEICKECQRCQHVFAKNFTLDSFCASARRGAAVVWLCVILYWPIPVCVRCVLCGLINLYIGFSLHSHSRPASSPSLSRLGQAHCQLPLHSSFFLVFAFFSCLFWLFHSHIFQTTPTTMRKYLA